MKIAIFTLTMDRLEYTRHCFRTLEERSGVPYDHFVVDNGSEDGTQDWLNKNKYKYKKIILNGENRGIGMASNQALEEIFKENYDLIIKFDNDCEVVSENILGQIVEVYEGIPRFASKYILSPRVEGINTNLDRIRYEMFAGRRVGLTGMVGGIFMCVPKVLYDNFRYDNNRKRIGLDSQMCQNSRQHGANCGYIEGLVVNHYETTDGQAKRYPDYFKLKKKETDEETASRKN